MGRYKHDASSNDVTAVAALPTGKPALAKPQQPKAEKTVSAAAAEALVAQPVAEATVRSAAPSLPTSDSQAAASAAPKAKAKSAPVTKPAKPQPEAPADAPAKAKLVRDSFTMPRADFALIAALKERALGFQRPTKKSELLRAGLQVLAALDDAQLQAALARLVPLKTGRPKKG